MVSIKFEINTQYKQNIIYLITIGTLINNFTNKLFEKNRYLQRKLKLM